jgi:hypothetical protein
LPLVYCVLCHHAPDDVRDLLALIHRPEHHYLLHVDRKASARLHETAARLATAAANVHVLPSALCAWAGWSLVATTLRAIAQACAMADDWSHFILLSETHVPLHSPEATQAALRAGVSVMEARPLSELHRDARNDVLHRFAARYHELPGVGGFATVPRALSPAFLATVHHGGQWLVLARDACARLAAARESPIWEPFRTSLLPDETALQSVLLGSDIGRGLAIQRAATTYVAWPSLGGVGDMRFGEANFFDARAQNYLFIRKRPAVLPEKVAEALAEWRAPMEPPPLPEGNEVVPGGPEVAALAAALYQGLAARFNGIEVMTLRPRHAGGGPTAFLHVRWPGLPAPLVVALVSEDLAQFKALLAWRVPFDMNFRTVTLGGYPTSLLKVRLPDLFEAREVILPDLLGGGFITIAPGGSIAPLLATLAHLLLTGARLAPALEP